MKNHTSRIQSRLWMYRLRSPIWTDIQLLKPERIAFVKECLRNDDTPRRQKTAFYTDLYRDYPGVLLTVEGDEGFLDMECLEVPNIDTWYRDFADAPEPANGFRIHPLARERIKVLGTLFQAYLPVPSLLEAIKRKTLEFKAVEDWETALKVCRPRHDI